MPTQPNPSWAKPFKAERAAPAARSFFFRKCILELNAYQPKNVCDIPVFSRKVITILFSTKNRVLQPGDTCVSAVDKTVETVNNILYMQQSGRICEKNLTKAAVGAIIIRKNREKQGDICCIYLRN